MLELRQENEDLKEDLGYIKIEDPDKVYVRQLETVEMLTWRFRVYLPPEKRYFVMARIGRKGGGSGIQKLNEQFTITIGLQRSEQGSSDGWDLRYTMPDRSGSTMADAQAVRKMLESDAFSIFERVQIRREAKEFAADADVELLRFSNGEFRVWLEPHIPRKKKNAALTTSPNMDATSP